MRLGKKVATPEKILEMEDFSCKIKIHAVWSTLVPFKAFLISISSTKNILNLLRKIRKYVKKENKIASNSAT